MREDLPRLHILCLFSSLGSQREVLFWQQRAPSNYVNCRRGAQNRCERSESYCGFFFALANPCDADVFSWKEFLPSSSGFRSDLRRVAHKWRRKCELKNQVCFAVQSAVSVWTDLCDLLVFCVKMLSLTSRSNVDLTHDWSDVQVCQVLPQRLSRTWRWVPCRVESCCLMIHINNYVGFVGTINMQDVARHL